MSKIFHVLPPSSALYPGDKPQTVIITFRSEKEMEIKDLSILKCQVICRQPLLPPIADPLEKRKTSEQRTSCNPLECPLPIVMYICYL